MRRRVLILTDTYFQLIVAIQLKRTEYCNDEVDIIITDHSTGCEEAAERLRTERLFRSVFFVHDDNSVDESVFHKVKRYLNARMHPRQALRRYAALDDGYDVVLFSNASLLAHLICFCFRNQAACYRMEEGYSTYTRPLLVKKPLRKVMIRMAFGDLGKRLRGLYLFHPELFQQTVTYPILPLKGLDKRDEELKEVLNRIFEYDDNREAYDADFIFLEEAFRLSGAEVDDIDVIRHISEVVGIENLVVKRHPRNKVELSPGNKIRVNRVVGIPWELVLMNEDFSGKTLLTITSSSALAPVLFAFEPTKVYLLYQCVQKKSPMMDAGYLQFISKLQEDHENIIVPTGIPDLLQRLRTQMDEKL